MTERNLETNPYTPDEERVCAYLEEIAPDIGCGDDPIGFLIASHACLVAERKIRYDQG